MSTYAARFANRIMSDITGFKTSLSQAADINPSTEEKKTQTNQRGRDLLEFTITTVYADTIGHDVMREVDLWNNMLSEVGWLDFNGRGWGVVVQLRKVDPGEIKVNAAGKWVYAKVTLTFKEYDDKTTAVKKDISALLAAGPPMPAKDSKAKDSDVGKRVGKGNIEGLKVGDFVTLTGTTYATGQTIPAWVKGMKHKVSLINAAQDKVLVGKDGGICSWVRLSEVTL